MALICLRMKCSNKCITFPRKIIQKEKHHKMSLEFHPKYESSLHQRKLTTMRNHTLEVIILFFCLLPICFIEFFPIHKYIYNFIMFTLLSGEYFSSFFNKYFFFVLLLSALHFSQFYFLCSGCFLPPHRKEISYFSICWNKQL